MRKARGGGWRVEWQGREREEQREGDVECRFCFCFSWKADTPTIDLESRSRVSFSVKQLKESNFVIRHVMMSCPVLPCPVRFGERERRGVSVGWGVVGGREDAVEIIRKFRNYGSVDMLL